MNVVTGYPEFPPLFSGLPAPSGMSTEDFAVAMATEGCDAGTVVYDFPAGHLSAAAIFAPDVPLREAAIMLPLCGVGLQNALGALVAPEVAVQLEWDGTIRVNGGRCGKLNMRASTLDPEAVPNWLLVRLAVRFLPDTDDGGTTPDETSLYAEGCGDVTPTALLEAWVRHSLVWLDTWDREGTRALHREWSGLFWSPVGELDGGTTGSFVGIDEHFGMLLKNGEHTSALPLTTLLDRTE